MSTDDAWADLNAALEDYAPPCSGLHLFVADSRTDDQRDECSVICGRCPIRDLCHHYAVASRVDAGYWAGIDRASRGRGRPRTSTTDAGAVSTAPITQKEETP
ncbi:WhiB family transcriptional regulator [Microbacterium sp. NRRL B-14842]|uniref:WhiB family transcriptional regulator n=1 Tax=Microbacterium sp. NRRL B-14842 TaxID=3162881 RepID=UPI0035133C0B